MRTAYRVLSWILYVSIISTITLSFSNGLSAWWPAAFIVGLVVNLYFHGKWLEANVPKKTEVKE